MRIYSIFNGSKENEPSAIRIAGWLGPGLVALGATVAAFAYHGRTGESYSPFNHFISELGEMGVSRWALFYNVLLTTGNLCLIFFTVGVARSMGGGAGLVFGGLGILAGLGGTFSAIFPMNHLVPHLAAAMLFFYSGMMAVGLFSVYVLFARATKWPRGMALPGLVTVGCFGAFLVEGSRWRHQLPVVIRMLYHRPDFWLFPFLEWLVLISLLTWMVLVAWTVKGDSKAAVLPPG